jgi:signal transduction histidine kinase
MRFDELKNDLVATVAHEFRTPLTSLRMAIHLLAEEQVGALNPKQADLAAAAREECERLQGIVDDLLDLSRIQAGRMELSPERVPVAALLDAAAAALHGGAEAAGLTLERGEPPAEAAVSADPERLQLVLSNLVGNAVRHTPRGGRVTLSARPEGDRIRFEVSDTGEGIAPEYQERIFEKFFRVPGAQAGGVGLGLYLAREIVQAHGGEMGVRSAPGQGSTFWFTIPRDAERVVEAAVAG